MKLKRIELSRLIESLLFEGNDASGWVKDIKDTKYGKAAVKTLAAMGVTYYAFPEKNGTSPSYYKLPDGEKYFYDKGTTGETAVEAIISNNSDNTEVYIYHPENKPEGI